MCGNCAKLEAKLDDQFIELNKVRLKSEEAECAHRILDDNNVPKEIDGKDLSLVGRIQLSWEILK